MRFLEWNDCNLKGLAQISTKKTPRFGNKYSQRLKEARERIVLRINWKLILIISENFAIPVLGNNWISTALGLLSSINLKLIAVKCSPLSSLNYEIWAGFTRNYKTHFHTGGNLGVGCSKPYTAGCILSKRVEFIHTQAI